MLMGTESPPRFDLDQIALLLDVDGTLLDIAPTPGSVHVPGDLRATLGELVTCDDCAVALVSGRPVAQLDAIFSPLRLAAIGCHGAEMRALPGASLQTRVPFCGEIKQRLARAAARFPSVLFEDKTYSVAIHYRNAPVRESDIMVAIKAAMGNDPFLELLPGKAVIEIKPSGYDKGTACVELLQRPPYAGRRPVFLGDDVTDEAAFAVLPAFNGIGISVGREMPGARYLLQTPKAVRAWLKALIR